MNLRKIIKYLADLLDVEYPSGTPTDGQVLTYDGVSSKWKPENATGGLVGDLPSVQIRRTTTYSFTNSYTDVSFDTTDIENDESILEHDNTNKDRINIKTDGLYLILYSMGVESNNNGKYRARVRKNDTSVIQASSMEAEDSNDVNDFSHNFIVELSSGDFITLQIENDVGSDETVEIGATFTITSLSGIKGEKGDKGDDGGTTVDVQKDDTTVKANVDIINFEGDVDVTPELGNKVTIQVNGATFLHHYFYYAEYDDTFGAYKTQRMSNGSDFEFNFKVPDNFTTLDELKLVFAPTANIGADDRAILQSNYGSLGESYNQHAESNTIIAGYTGTQNQWTELDISSVFSSLTAGDYCGLNFENDTNHDSYASVHVLGIKIVYH